MNQFDALASKVKALDATLAGWTAKLNNPRYFRPVMKIEWDRTFDARERAKTALCHLDRERYAALFPNEPNDR